MGHGTVSNLFAGFAAVGFSFRPAVAVERPGQGLGELSRGLLPHLPGGTAATGPIRSSSNLGSSAVRLRNVLIIQFQSITALPVGGSLLLDSPAGFAVEVSAEAERPGSPPSSGYFLPPGELRSAGCGRGTSVPGSRGSRGSGPGACAGLAAA